MIVIYVTFTVSLCKEYTSSRNVVNAVCNGIAGDPPELRSVPVKHARDPPSGYWSGIMRLQRLEISGSLSLEVRYQVKACKGLRARD